MQTRLYVLLATGVAVLTVAFVACCYQFRPGASSPALELVITGEGGPPNLDLDAIDWRDRARRAIVVELLERQRTLPEAAARFREIDRHPLSDRKGTDEPTAPGLSEGERYCRLVIRYAEVVLEEQSPQRKAEEVARLEAELKTLRGRDGEIHLPDPEAVKTPRSREANRSSP